MTTQHDDVRPAARPTREDAVVRHLQRLGSQLAESPAEDRRAATRDRLVAMAAVRPTAGTTGSPGAVRPSLTGRLRGNGAPRWRIRGTAGLAGAVLTVCALGGLLAASQGATPGDLLYAVKRGGEQTRLALAGDATRGRTLLDLARTRLTELGAITQDEPDPDVAAAVDTLATMDELTTRGAREVTLRSVAAGDATSLTELGSWAAGQGAGLTALADDLPEPAGPALSGSTSLVTAVAERATALARALECVTGPAVADADDLGPLPAPCSSTARTATRDEGDGSTADASAAAGEVTAAPPGVPAELDTAAPAPAPVLGGAAPPAPATTVPAGAATAAPEGGTGTAVEAGSAGRPTPAPDAPGPGGPPVPLPARPHATSTPPAAGPAPARTGTPPIVDLPLPLCVTALGLPVLC